MGRPRDADQLNVPKLRPTHAVSAKTVLQCMRTELTTLEVTMLIGRIPLALAIALLVVTSVGFSDSVAIPRPDGCKRVVTSGHAFVGHRCRAGKRVTRVDHNTLPHNPHRANEHPRRERPLERLLTRGDGRIKAQGDKGARRELREKNLHGAGVSRRRG
jgi:hypothetical protein